MSRGPGHDGGVTRCVDAARASACCGSSPAPSRAGAGSRELPPARSLRRAAGRLSVASRRRAGGAAGAHARASARDGRLRRSARDGGARSGAARTDGASPARALGARRVAAAASRGRRADGHARARASAGAASSDCPSRACPRCRSAPTRSLWRPTPLPPAPPLRVALWTHLRAAARHGGRRARRRAARRARQRRSRSTWWATARPRPRSRRSSRALAPRCLRWTRDCCRWPRSQRAARAHCCLGIFGAGEKAAHVIPYKVHEALCAGRPVISGRHARRAPRARRTVASRCWSRPAIRRARAALDDARPRPRALRAARLARARDLRRTSSASTRWRARSTPSLRRYVARRASAR